MGICKALKILTGIKMVPNINIAIQKVETEQAIYAERTKRLMSVPEMLKDIEQISSDAVQE